MSPIPLHEICDSVLYCSLFDPAATVQSMARCHPILSHYSPEIRGQLPCDVDAILGARRSNLFRLRRSFNSAAATSCEFNQLPHRSPHPAPKLSPFACGQPPPLFVVFLFRFDVMLTRHPPPPNLVFAPAANNGTRTQPASQRRGAVEVVGNQEAGLRVRMASLSRQGASSCQ